MYNIRKAIKVLTVKKIGRSQYLVGLKVISLFFAAWPYCVYFEQIDIQLCDAAEFRLSTSAKIAIKTDGFGIFDKVFCKIRLFFQLSFGGRDQCLSEVCIWMEVFEIDRSGGRGHQPIR